MVSSQMVAHALLIYKYIVLFSQHKSAFWGGGERGKFEFCGEWAGKGEGGEARNTNQQLQ